MRSLSYLLQLKIPPEPNKKELAFGVFHDSYREKIVAIINSNLKGEVML